MKKPFSLLFSSFYTFFKSPLRAALGVAILLFIWMLTGAFKDPSAQKDSLSPKESPLFYVDVQPSYVKKKEIPLSLTGTTQPNRVVTLAAKVPGTIDHIFIKKGNLVQKGTLLALVDSKARLAHLKEAQSFKAQNKLGFHVQRELHKRGFSSKIALKKSAAQFESAQAKEKTMQKELEDTEIRAPFESILDHNFVEVGSYIKEGEHLFTLLDLNPILIKVSVSENINDKIREGGKAIVQFLSGDQREGAIIFKSSQAHDKTHAFLIEISLPNPSYTLKAGQTVDVTFFLEEREIHIIPSHLPTLREDGALVVRHLGENNVVLESPIKITFSEGENIWVEGLPSQARLITKGQEFVQAGQIVGIAPSSVSQPSEFSS